MSAVVTTTTRTKGRRASLVTFAIVMALPGAVGIVYKLLGCVLLAAQSDRRQRPAPGESPRNFGQIVIG